MTSPDIEKRLAAIKAREEKATPRPWVIYTPAEEYNEIRGASGRHVAGQSTDRLFGDVDARENAEFIAEARDDVPWLVEQVERLQQEALVAAAERGLLRKAEAEVERLREFAKGCEGDGGVRCDCSVMFSERPCLPCRAKEALADD